jgi:hypothetical protein
MPRGIFITYVCDGVGSLKVPMKTGGAIFIPVFLCHRQLIGG